MSGNDRTREYFDREHSDFDAAYDLNSQGDSSKDIKDVVRKISYFYNKKAIKGRMEALVGLVGDDIKEKRILEVGCGPGFYSIRLAQKGADVTALDYAEGMIETAKRNAERSGVKLHLIKADFRDACFPDNSFDYIFATGVIDYIRREAHKELLDKMTRLSKRFVIVSFPKRYVLHALVRKLWLNVLKKVYVTFFTDKEITRLAASSGLKEVSRVDVGILYVIKFEKVG